VRSAVRRKERERLLGGYTHNTNRSDPVVCKQFRCHWPREKKLRTSSSNQTRVGKGPARSKCKSEGIGDTFEDRTVAVDVGRGCAGIPFERRRKEPDAERIFGGWGTGKAKIEPGQPCAPIQANAFRWKFETRKNHGASLMCGKIACGAGKFKQVAGESAVMKHGNIVSSSQASRGARLPQKMGKTRGWATHPGGHM